jgi:hypothetical protein
MELTVRLVDDAVSADTVRSLASFLRAERELRGQVHAEEKDPERESMGSVGDLLTVAIGSGGALTVLLASVSTWLKNSRSDIKVEIRGKRGSAVIIDAKRVKSIDDAQLRKILQEAHNNLTGK